MEAIQNRVESWIRDQRAKIMKVSWGPLQWRMRWPPWINGDQREQRKKIQQEYERRRKQLHDLCLAVKAESVSDLQDILCCMVLSECVYKVTNRFCYLWFWFGSRESWRTWENWGMWSLGKLLAGLFRFVGNGNACLVSDFLTRNTYSLLVRIFILSFFFPPKVRKWKCFAFLFSWP